MEEGTPLLSTHSVQPRLISCAILRATGPIESPPPPRFFTIVRAKPSDDRCEFPLSPRDILFRPPEVSVVWLGRSFSVGSVDLHSALLSRYASLEHHPRVVAPRWCLSTHLTRLISRSWHLKPTTSRRSAECKFNRLRFRTRRVFPRSRLKS